MPQKKTSLYGKANSLCKTGELWGSSAIEKGASQRFVLKGIERR